MPTSHPQSQNEMLVNCAINYSNREEKRVYLLRSPNIAIYCNNSTPPPSIGVSAANLPITITTPGIGIGASNNSALVFSGFNCLNTCSSDAPSLSQAAVLYTM